MNLQSHSVTDFCENIIVHYSFGCNDTNKLTIIINIFEMLAKLGVFQKCDLKYEKSEIVSIKN